MSPACYQILWSVPRSWDLIAKPWDISCKYPSRCFPYRRRNVLKSGGARANSTDPGGILSFPVEGLLNPMFKPQCRHEQQIWSFLRVNAEICPHSKLDFAEDFTAMYIINNHLCMRLLRSPGERYYSKSQGCGVGVENGVGVGRSRSFWLEPELELETVKFTRQRLQPGVAS